jgi:hypothetical protein
MRRVWVIAFSLLVMLSAVVIGSHADSSKVRGDYVEVRTASVFAGACHYNGELTTTGRDALMAWNIKSGQWRGVDLTGVRAVAIVNADENLSYNTAVRRSEIIIDQGASGIQQTALIEALKSKYGASLGNVTSVRRGPVNFDHEARKYSVTASDLASITVSAMPNDECCRMPNLVWYSPLVPLTNRKVGYTENALYVGGAVGDEWQRAGENSAFYGDFTF